MSLDGFIAGPDGEYDWITMDSSVDFGSFFKAFDTVLMGRRTYEVARANAGAMFPDIQTIVCSRTLTKDDAPGVRIAHDAAATVAELKKEAGKDIWLFGGGNLFRSLLTAGLVEVIEVSVMPILLSQGVPLLPAGKRSPRLKLTNTTTLPSGIVGLCYLIEYGPDEAASA